MGGAVETDKFFKLYIIPGLGHGALERHGQRHGLSATDGAASCL